MDNKKTKIIRVGSRKSELALVQTNYVIDCLKKVYSDVDFEIVTMTTLGDRILDISLPKIGEKSLFTKDLEDALLSGSVDFVVHSLKDLPTSLPDGLAIGAVFKREDPRDALVMREDLRKYNLETLPPQSYIGTSSLRRTAQLRASYPHLRVVDVRGNLNTRLKKLHDGSANIASGVDALQSLDVSSENGAGVKGTQVYSALILAQSGLVRLGKEDEISEVLHLDKMLYAVGQGALAVECRTDNARLLSMLTRFNHPETYCAVLAERSFLRTLGGGCSAPVGISTSLESVGDKYTVSIKGAVWSLDGAAKVEESMQQTIELNNLTRNDRKRFKTDSNPNDARANQTDGYVNPIEEHNRLISERSAECLNCEDLVSHRGARVFCGMTQNYNLKLEVVERFEELGRELANKLVGKGALEIMKITQDIIRASVGK